MKKSLYTKLVFVMLLLIISLMAVVGAFLMNEIRSYYLEDFYAKMKTVFEDPELASSLRAAADDSSAPEKMTDILKTYSGLLGIDSRSRTYCILSGDTGEYLDGSTENKNITATRNILTAIGGKAGTESDASASYMDLAIPFKGTTGSYIVYVKDNKSTVHQLSSVLFGIIAEALLVGLIISALLSMLLAKAMVTPIVNLTNAAERVAGGDFSSKPVSGAQDEIGVLTRTFDGMAGQLEKTLDDLKRSEEMRKQFVANVSHELRTPITSIRSYAETLMDNEGLPKETEQQFLGVILKESDRMTNLVADLLTLSKFDAGSYEFHFERFSFERSLQDIYSAMLLEAQKHGHEFTLDIASPLPEIIGDKARLEQVLINMVTNALKYTPDGGEITLSAGTSGKKVFASVRDNGIGIPADDVDKVFERFYRVDKARSRESGGTGLGLSIAKEIVARHSGELTLESGLGKGTVITMTLPVEGPAHG